MLNENYPVLQRVSPLETDNRQFNLLRQRIDAIGDQLRRGTSKNFGHVGDDINAEMLRLQAKIPVDLEVEGILEKNFHIAPFDLGTVQRYKTLQVAKEIATNRWAKVEWHLSPLDQYRQGNYLDEVPIDAITFSTKVAGVLPLATWHVDHMVLTERPVQPKLDPFLVMGYKGELYYLYVWNEPDFLAMIG